MDKFKCLQDFAWSSLPKEVRVDMRERYRRYNIYNRNILDHFFGRRNLSSYDEPEEMLIIPRKGVQKIYHDKLIEKNDTEDKSRKDIAIGWISAMRFFFSKNKCEKCGANTQQCMDSPCQNYLTKKTVIHDKELNLCNLLKSCEGEIFYCPFYGNITFKEINSNNVIICSTDDRDVKANFWSSGIAYYTKGSVSLFPSLALYEKYPLDAPQAWQEWSEERKPKRWRANHQDAFFYITSEGQVWTRQDCRDDVSDNNYNFGNYFRTESEAKEMVVKIKELLLNGK